jgi:ribosome-binding protein aMBF1 (putative translation factor)
MTLKSSLPSLAADPDSMIRRIRLARELTVEELSLRSKIPVPVIRHWERTNTCPEKEELRNLAMALHAKVSTLTGKGRYVPPMDDLAGVPDWFIAATQRILTLFPQRR